MSAVLRFEEFEEKFYDFHGAGWCCRAFENFGSCWKVKIIVFSIIGCLSLTFNWMYTKNYIPIENITYLPQLLYLLSGISFALAFVALSYAIYDWATTNYCFFPTYGQAEALDAYEEYTKTGKII